MKRAAAVGRVDRQVELGWVAAAAYVVGIGVLAALSPAGLAVLIGLTILVLIHEGGHLAVARRCGIAVEEYFAGFGPVVLAWRTREGLRVGLKVIPAGGYVKVVGMSRREVVVAELESSTYRAASRRARLAVVAAGPIFNVAFGFLLLVVASVVEGGRSAPEAIAEAWQWTSTVAVTTVQGLGAVLGDLGGYGSAIVDPSTAGEVPSRFLSPIGVAQISTDLAAHGPGPLIRLMAIASIGLGVMNSLPLPPLDGGHAAIVGVEAAVAKVLRRPALRIDVTNRVVAAVTALTFVLVIALGASALLFDIASPVTL